MVYLFLRAAFLAGDAGRGALIASAGALGAGDLILPNEPTEANGKVYEGHEKMEPPNSLPPVRCTGRAWFFFTLKI